MNSRAVRDELEADRALLRRTFEVRRYRGIQRARCRLCLKTWWVGVAQTREGISLQLLEHARAHQGESVA